MFLFFKSKPKWAFGFIEIEGVIMMDCWRAKIEKNHNTKEDCS